MGVAPRTPCPPQLCGPWAGPVLAVGRSEERAAREGGRQAVGVLEVRGPTPGETGTEKEEMKGEI